jgi:hypothetical protein
MATVPFDPMPNSLFTPFIGSQGCHSHTWGGLLSPGSFWGCAAPQPCLNHLAYLEGPGWWSMAGTRWTPSSVARNSSRALHTGTRRWLGCHTGLECSTCPSQWRLCSRPDPGGTGEALPPGTWWWPWLQLLGAGFQEQPPPSCWEGSRPRASLGSALNQKLPSAQCLLILFSLDSSVSLLLQGHGFHLLGKQPQEALVWLSFAARVVGTWSRLSGRTYSPLLQALRALPLPRTHYLGEIKVCPLPWQHEERPPRLTLSITKLAGIHPFVPIVIQTVIHSPRTSMSPFCSDPQRAGHLLLFHSLRGGKGICPDVLNYKYCKRQQ